MIEPFAGSTWIEPSTIVPAAGIDCRICHTRIAISISSRSIVWDVDHRQYITFVHDTRTIALRAWASSSDASEGNTVPFYLQPTLGGAASLRGFRSFRFRDESALLLQAEYRWRINELIAGALFYDTGAVARPVCTISARSNARTTDSASGLAAATASRSDRSRVRRAAMAPDSFLRFDDVFCTICALPRPSPRSSSPLAVVGHAALAQSARTALQFFPDDPILRDDDAALDASGIKERELSEATTSSSRRSHRPAMARDAAPST